MKITTETALQWCAEIVPEWWFTMGTKGGAPWTRVPLVYSKKEAEQDARKPFDNLNDSARLVEAFVGEDTEAEKSELFLDYLEQILWPFAFQYNIVMSSARQRTLAALSAYVGELVEVDNG